MKYFLTILTIGLLSSCHAINQSCGLQDDNVCEEISEDFLRCRTGIILDFTPDSLEPLVP